MAATSRTWMLAQQQSEVTTLRVVRMSDGSSTALTDGRTNVRRPRWSLDGRYLFYVANRDGPPDLWRQSVADDGSTAGEPERVTAGSKFETQSFRRTVLDSSTRKDAGSRTSGECRFSRTDRPPGETPSR